MRKRTKPPHTHTHFVSPSPKTTNEILVITQELLMKLEYTSVPGINHMKQFLMKVECVIFRVDEYYPTITNGIPLWLASATDFRKCRSLFNFHFYHKSAFFSSLI